VKIVLERMKFVSTNHTLEFDVQVTVHRDKLLQ